ncbi:hypothetical protein B4119_3403 [Parageobacillus caldoxylosilyticus]|uniref:Uncharacterized protein n=1 Tax=Saccharococcus caldoxylosilyticus TaxID=81408 RepID=A0A150L7F8_9BACL|nr:hypothetical protein B4119_3403 [Parageobacillus caldoxylosilyticus]
MAFSHNFETLSLFSSAKTPPEEKEIKEADKAVASPNFKNFIFFISYPPFLIFYNFIINY